MSFLLFSELEGVAAHNKFPLLFSGLEGVAAHDVAIYSSPISCGTLTKMETSVFDRIDHGNHLDQHFRMVSY